ncbi:Hypothetical predicted protein [Xyrichtys novacula]|uniref:Uncharacterized protein n=1 Tax=Xyrichtys novacula TaxID=13765 RepID=A0AAV1HHU9_XYRNO|nr:Hypothetical predicted protein [Xyrichtys novacula]
MELSVVYECRLQTRPSQTQMQQLVTALGAVTMLSIELVPQSEKSSSGCAFPAAPLPPESKKLNTETFKVPLLGIDNTDQTASHQTKPPSNKLSSLALKSEVVR